ncbi:MAG: hypothetical protein JNK87_41010 [Bryobacterales bacterium]|nr:hypothetical protein [Bryobacterales bacterium]
MHPALPLDDKALLDALLERAGMAMEGANPYESDGAFARKLLELPVGLRAMAATYWLDISISKDDLGWHFLNFGEPALVRETEAALRELGMEQHAAWFAEAHTLMRPLLDEIDSPEGYYRITEERGVAGRIMAMTKPAWNADRAAPVGKSCIFTAWVRYARAKPQNVFTDNPPAEDTMGHGSRRRCAHGSHEA